MSKAFRNFQETVVQSFKQNAENTNYSSDFAFAVSHSVFPIFDRTYCAEFADDFEVSEEFVTSIEKYTEENQKATYETFLRQFHDDNSESEKAFRLKLLRTLRYLYLANHLENFDWDFFTNANPPLELKSIPAKFDSQIDVCLR